MDDPAKVLGRYLDGDRLTVMPKQGRKRRIVLEHVAQGFEPGIHYAETEVNSILRPVWDDAAALRRYLVEEGLLDRTPDGTYWRSGGPVDVVPGADG